jgi:uncharacterized SAM-binding protein YcdF (DUF218 family)
MTLYSLYVQPWLLPPGVNFLIIFMGLIIWLFCWRMTGAIIMIIGFMSLWLLSTPIVAYNIVNLLQDQYPILKLNDLNNPKAHHAIVVLGGGDTVEAEYDNKHTVSDTTLHRMNYAVYLHQKTHLPIILSGGKSKGYNVSEADLISNLMQNNFNIKTDSMEDQSLTTADESKFLLPILKQNKLDGIYLVTNAWHMPRSVFIFQCAGIKVIPAPMGHYVYGPGYSLISYFPNMDALYASSVAMHEWIGLFWYHLYYGHQCLPILLKNTGRLSVTMLRAK